MNSAKLERHLGNCEAMIVVLTEREDGVSPHIMYEISLALRAGKPALVFIEDTLPTDIVPAHVLQRRFSLRSFPRSVREHRQALTILHTHTGSGVPRHQRLSTPRTCLLLGTAILEPQLGATVEQYIRHTQKYEVIRELWSADSVPAEYRSRILDSNVDSTTLSELISAEIEIYEEDFLELPDGDSADRYTQFLINLESQGRYTTRTAERAVEVVVGDR